MEQLNEKFSELSWNDKDDKIKSEIRVVVGLDFGTTYSGFAYCHASENKNICSNDLWHGEAGQLKTNTVLQYDDEFNNVKSWGAPALAKKQSRRVNSNQNNRPVELFKLHLGDILDKFKPKLPVEYRKAITDYLREIGKVIKETVTTRWPKIDYFKDVLLVLTVPAEFSEKSKAIMRISAFEAGLINDKSTANLQFTTEPEAGAIYCMENLKGQDLAQPGTNFMIVDCGGGTVDLTTRKFINVRQLGEITERTGDFCGSTYVDKEFIKYLQQKLGDGPMDLLRDNHYGQMQYLIQEFCKSCKIPFTGEDPDFLYELDIQDTAPVLKQYITNSDIRKDLEEDEWVIDIDFETMKSIFEPVVQKIFRLIKGQLDNAQEACSAIFLVGGFSESKYLQNRIKQEFNHRVNNNISVPIQPMAAIARGAVIYGLSLKPNDLESDMKCIISSRILKYTYGVKIADEWKSGDPVHKKDDSGYVFDKFDCLAKRGTKMNVDEEVTRTYYPIYLSQQSATYNIYYTQEYDAKYCDDPGMKLLGSFTVDLPGTGTDRKVLFAMTFGKMEIIAVSKNELTGQSYRTTFKFNLDD